MIVILDQKWVPFGQKKIKFKAWLEVEILACEAWAELGDIPKEDVVKIRENASFDIESY